MFAYFHGNPRIDGSVSHPTTPSLRTILWEQEGTSTNGRVFYFSYGFFSHHHGFSAARHKGLVSQFRSLFLVAKYTSLSYNPVFNANTLLLDNLATSFLISTTTFCTPINAKGYFYAFWIPILCFETLLCVLACIRGYKSYKDHEIRAILRHRKLSQPGEVQLNQDSNLSVLEILLRDSVGYFVMYVKTSLTPY